MNQCGFHWDKAPITHFSRSLFSNLAADGDQLFLPVYIFPPQGPPGTPRPPVKSLDRTDAPFGSAVHLESADRATSAHKAVPLGACSDCRRRASCAGTSGHGRLRYESAFAAQEEAELSGARGSGEDRTR